MSRSFYALAVVFCLIGCGHPAHALPLEYLPAESPAYAEIEALSAAGLIDSLAVFSRPLLRLDLASSLLRAERTAPSVESNLHFQRLVREVARELRALGRDGPPITSRSLLERDVGTSKIRLSVDARLYGDFDDKRGPAHFQLRDRSAAVLSGAVQFASWLGVYEDIGFTRIRSQRAFIDPIINHTDLELSVLRAGMTASSGAVQASLGYESYRWGPGRRGTLLLSDAAGPFTSLQIRGRLGRRFTATAISGVLSRADQKGIAAPRIEATISPRLTIGLGEAVRFPSSGFDLLYATGLLPYAVVERIQIRDASSDSIRGTRRANIMASMDVILHLGAGVTPYGEFLVDDLATEDQTMPDRIGYQVGVRLDRDPQWASIHARAEYTRVRRFTYATYYGQDFIYRDRPLGFDLGPDVAVLWLEGSVDLSRDWTVRSTAEFARNGEGFLGESWDPANGFLANGDLSGTVERRREFWADLEWLPRAHTTLSVGLGLRRVENQDHVLDAQQSSLLGRFAIEARY